MAQRSYLRTDDSMSFPDGAVVVGIGWEPDLVPLAAPTANVSWSTVIRRGDQVEGASEGPYEVEEAFARADMVRDLYGLDQVMVSIARAEFWRPEWGDLVEDE